MNTRLKHFTQHRNGQFVQITWAILLLAGSIYFPLVTLFTSMPSLIWIQVSLFDLILPGFGIWCFINSGLRKSAKQLTFITFIAISAICIHYLVSTLYANSASLVWQFKEAAKLIVVIIQFSLLVLIFQNLLTKIPSQNTIGIVLFAACCLALLQHFRDGGHYPLSRTSYAISLNTLLFFYLASHDIKDKPQQIIKQLFAGAVVLFTCAVIQNKGGATIALVITLWTTVFNWDRFQIFVNSRTLKTVLVLLFGLLLGLFVSDNQNTIARFVDLPQTLGSMDLLSRSIGVRIDLWSVALNGFTQNFPFGLGLGGYEEAIKTMGAEPSIPKLATEAHKYPHNTFLGLLAELGLLGVIFCAAILFLLFKSSKNWSIKTRIPFLAVTLLPLLIHDAHTIRLLILLIAFSFVHSNCIDNKRNA